ncbi:MAG: hypothetical protein RL742_801 [Bacteroidota bacterium]|jgi:hypothetical protein
MRKITCIGCRRESFRYIEAPLAFGCPYCGKIMARDDAEAAWQPAKPLPGRPEYVKPGWLRPGAQLRMDDKIFTVFNILTYHAYWEEWDSEDQRWARGAGKQDEWYAEAADGETLCLEIDDGLHFIRREQERPAAAVCRRFQSNDPHCIERGEYYLYGFEGEDDEPLDRRHYKYSVLDEQGDLCAEWLLDNFEGSVRFYRYHYVSATELERMRVRDESELRGYADRLPGLAFYRLALGIAALCLLVLWLGSLGRSDQTLARTRIPFSAYQPDDSLQRSQSLGRFRLAPQRAYRVDLRCELPENAAAGFDLTLVQVSDGQVVNSIGCEFATESGVDSDGAWTESTLEDHFYFQSGLGGELEAFVSPARTAFSGMPLRGGYLTFTVAPLTLSRYYFIGFFILGAAFFVFQWKLENTRVALGLAGGAWLHTARDGMARSAAQY